MYIVYNIYIYIIYIWQKDSASAGASGPFLLAFTMKTLSHKPERKFCGIHNWRMIIYSLSSSWLIEQGRI